MTEAPAITRDTVRSPWYTKAEACVYMRISMDTLDRWIADGRIKLHKVEGLQSVRLHKDDMDSVFVPQAP